MAARRPKPETDDLELIERCLAGDPAAWVTLIDRYRRLIYSIPVKLGLPSEQADEVFQDVCVKLLSRLETLRDGRSLPRWLIVTAQRRSWDLSGYERRFTAEEDAPVATAPKAAEPEELVLESERAHLVRRALEKLSEACRALLEPMFYEDPPPSYAELAKRLGRPQGSLGPTRVRCLKTLRTRLREAGFE